jgi:hypothetical protein
MLIFAVEMGLASNIGIFFNIKACTKTALYIGYTLHYSGKFVEDYAV